MDVPYRLPPKGHRTTRIYNAPDIARKVDMGVSVIAGIVAASIVVAQFSRISSRLKEQPCDGNLRWSWGVLALGCIYLIFAGFGLLIFLFNEEVWKDLIPFLVVFVLFIACVLSAVQCFVEYYTVQGQFDAQGIQFRTPWTGEKSEQWRDLVSIKYSESFRWYTLLFNNGTKIRISDLLSGHQGVLDIVEELDL